MSDRVGLLLPGIVTLLAASAQLSSHTGGSGNVIRAKFGEQEPYHCDIFVSYCRKDKKYWERIDKYLVDVHQEGLVIYSYDTMEPGTSIRDETRSALLSSAVAVLLMSQDYIASGLMEREFLELLDQAEHRDKYILWLQVGLFRSRRTERLKRYKKIGAGSPPLDQLSGPKRDAIYMDLANVIWKRLGECNRFPKPSSEET